MTLREALLGAEQLPWNHHLFLPENQRWSLESPCSVLNLAEEENPENPPVARENGLRYALGVHDVQEIVSNARQQMLSPTVAQLLQAFFFYYDNDAFVDFSKTE